MKKKEITLYDSYYSREKENEIRAFLFEIYADEENWNSPEEIPDQRVYDEMTFQDGETWRDIKDGLNTIFEDGYYLLTGYCGTWRGRLDGGNFIRSLDDLISVIQHLDDMKISVELVKALSYYIILLAVYYYSIHAFGDFYMLALYRFVITRFRFRSVIRTHPAVTAICGSVASACRQQSRYGYYERYKNYYRPA